MIPTRELVVGSSIMVPIAQLRPNPWNPNSMDDSMLAMERASIEKFGFVSSLLVREAEDGEFEIIDGEHRWRIARQLNMEELPCWSVGKVSDLVAKELTLALREIHGEHDPVRVQAILRDIARSDPAENLRSILPYSDEVFARLSDLSVNFDWAALEEKARAKVVEPTPGPEKEARHWVERIYRLPSETAATLDEALRLARDSAGSDISDADALGIVATGYINGGD